MFYKSLRFLVASLASATVFFGFATPAFAGTPAPGVDCVTGATAPVSTYTLPVSSMADGAVAANSIANFTNAAASIVSNSSWTNSSTKYLVTSNGGGMIARSKYCSRDMEVDSWVRNGITYIRLDDNGNGIYFSINGDYTDSPWDMGYVKGFVDGTNFRYDAAATYMPPVWRRRIRHPWL